MDVPEKLISDIVDAILPSTQNCAGPANANNGKLEESLAVLETFKERVFKKTEFMRTPYSIEEMIHIFGSYVETIAIIMRIRACAYFEQIDSTAPAEFKKSKSTIDWFFWSENPHPPDHVFIPRIHNLMRTLINIGNSRTLDGIQEHRPEIKRIKTDLTKMTTIINIAQERGSVPTFFLFQLGFSYEELVSFGVVERHTNIKSLGIHPKLFSENPRTVNFLFNAIRDSIVQVLTEMDLPFVKHTVEERRAIKDLQIEQRNREQRGVMSAENSRRNPIDEARSVFRSMLSASIVQISEWVLLRPISDPTKNVPEAGQGMPLFSLYSRITSLSRMELVCVRSRELVDKILKKDLLKPLTFRSPVPSVSADEAKAVIMTYRDLTVWITERVTFERKFYRDLDNDKLILRKAVDSVLASGDTPSTDKFVRDKLVEEIEYDRRVRRGGGSDSKLDVFSRDMLFESQLLPRVHELRVLLPLSHVIRNYSRRFSTEQEWRDFYDVAVSNTSAPRLDRLSAIKKAVEVLSVVLTNGISEVTANLVTEMINSYDAISLLDVASNVRGPVILSDFWGDLEKLEDDNPGGNNDPRGEIYNGIKRIGPVQYITRTKTSSRLVSQLIESTTISPQEGNTPIDTLAAFTVSMIYCSLRFHMSNV